MSGCLLFRKGAWVLIRVQEPLDVATRRLRDANECLGAGSMLPLLELDEMLPVRCAHSLSEFVMAELDDLAVDLSFSACSPDASCDQV